MIYWQVAVMVLQFRGTAHPPPGASDPDVANLSAAEVGLTDLGRNGGLPLLFEHNAQRKVGYCQASWEGRNGELRVAGLITDPATEHSIRSGKNQGLSLGTDVVQDTSGRALYKEQQELSVCNEPRRPGCYIDTVDGKSVRQSRRFSAGKHAPLSRVRCPALINPANRESIRSNTYPMADAAVVAPETGETFTKEYVEKLKNDLASANESNAMLKAFKSTHDQKQRDVIAKLQPEVNGYLESLIKENPDHADDIKPLVEWSRSCHESNSLETAMPLARVMSCASAQFKRTREEASVASEKAGTLGTTMKELEDTKADNSAKSHRIAELESHCNELQSANGALQEELAKAGIIKDKFDFSKLSSREANAKEEAAAQPASSSAESKLTAVTSNASRGADVQDELMSFVRGSASGRGSGKIGQSGTGHSYLGATSGTLEGEIASAFGGF